MMPREILFPKMLLLAWRRARLAGFISGLVAVVLIPVVGRALLQNSPRNVPEFLNRLPDANDQEKMRQQQKGQQDFEAANAIRKKEVSEESAKLVKLATDLKTEIDKADKDTLSVSTVRKAEAIEKLARNIKEKMTLSIRSN